MSYTEDKQQQELLFNTLVTQALDRKEHLKFEYIKSTTMLYAAFVQYTGLKKVIKLFNGLAVAAFKEYCNHITTTKPVEFDLLRASAQYKICSEFYTKDLMILKDMFSEYWAYINEYHFTDQIILGKERGYHELWDHRKAKTDGKR